MQKSNSKIFSTVIAVVMIIVILGGCGSSSPSSGKKYSDLSDVQKKNAKWAYDVSKSLK